MSLMLGLSVYWLRAKVYEFFLYMHFVLALVTLIACF